MSVNALKPSFHNREGYLAWRATWRTAYGELSRRIIKAKLAAKENQRSGVISQSQQNLRLMRADATKMMTLLSEAKLLRDRILAMKEQIAQQGFPLDLGDCRKIDFHFNKAVIAFPFMPKWVLKAKGKSYYVDHIDAAVPWNTRELDSGSTLGMIRFKRAYISIDKDGCAHLFEKVPEMA